MNRPFPAALAAAAILGAGLSPAFAQDAQAPAEAPVVATPQTAAPADPQGTSPAIVRPRGARGGGDCPWKSKNLTS